MQFGIESHLWPYLMPSFRIVSSERDPFDTWHEDSATGSTFVDVRLVDYNIIIGILSSFGIIGRGTYE